jgi:hypothetical protein
MPIATPRTPFAIKSKTLRDNAACEPLRAMLAKTHAASPKSWSNVESDFLRAMETFDAIVADGHADAGSRRNGKGEFFNDLLALILGNFAGVDLVSRSGVPGLIFPTHNLDVTYPPGKDVVIEFLLEAKTAGTPKHPENMLQRNPLGRPGHSDLPKRIKETGFKTIDLKAEYGRIMSELGEEGGGGPGGDLTTWLQEQRPRSYLFLAVRLVDEKHDLNHVVQLASQAALVQDRVGLFCFAPVSLSEPTTYRSVPVPSQLALGRVLHRASLDLKKLKSQTPRPLPTTPALAELAEDIVEEDGIDLELED